MTDMLPLTVFGVKGPILLGESPGLKLTGKVKWDNPFLKQVTVDGIGVDTDIFFFKSVLYDLADSVKYCIPANFFVHDPYQ
jgi:Tfp pilus assembly protein PilZ